MKKSLSEWTFGGRPVTAINLLLLISEMEGTYQHLKYMGFEEDMNAIDEMKKRYYSIYFKQKKKENDPSYSAVERATVNRLVPGSNPGEELPP